MIRGIVFRRIEEVWDLVKKQAPPSSRETPDFFGVGWYDRVITAGFYNGETHAGINCRR
jgi:hypothetical protein